MATHASILAWEIPWTKKLGGLQSMGQHSENEDHGNQSHHFMGNRWGNSGNSVRLYFLALLGQVILPFCSPRFIPKS